MKPITMTVHKMITAEELKLVPDAKAHLFGMLSSLAVGMLNEARKVGAMGKIPETITLTLSSELAVPDDFEPPQSEPTETEKLDKEMLDPPPPKEVRVSPILGPDGNLIKDTK